MGRSGRGWSYWNPGYVHPQYGADKPHDANPRIFFTEQSARNALTMWLQGEWQREVGTNVDWEGNAEDYEDLTVNKPPVERQRGDMEIVELSLVGPGL